MTIHVERRALLRAGLLITGGTALAGCSDRPAGGPSFVSPTGQQVRVAEARRRPGRVRDFRLAATEGPVDLAGRTVRTWTYGGAMPGAVIRVTAGEVVRARLTNHLPQATTIHWHGVALRNDADGVPDVTQPNIAAGSEYTYQFTAPHPGTYWFHPHAGTQLDRGLYAPLIVEDPREPLSYDTEWIVILDDWLDGFTGTPDQVLTELRRGMGGMDHGGGPPSEDPDGDMDGMDGMDHGGSTATAMPGTGSHMLMGAESELLGGDAGDVRYPAYLINGRTARDPRTFRARPGDRIRIRFINAGGDTAFRVALGGHKMTVTHTDGLPARPTPTDALLIGMGERYDVLVTAKSGAFPLTALAEGKKALTREILRTSPAAAAPDQAVRPRELDGRIVGYPDLRPADTARLPGKNPDRTIRLQLTGGMMKYDWAINGRKYSPANLFPVRSGERVRLSFVNRTTMWHPMHLHGHTFALTTTGLRKDTAIVLPRKTLDVDLDADNPGRWMIHCHNIYHAEAGMMTLLGYQA
jgi:FtsP/CotA-like multicopper oxidase with cupredoxin domain